MPRQKAQLQSGGAELYQPKRSESIEQQCVFTWAQYQLGKYPELELLFHIPNGGLRNKATAGRLKAEGVKAGVPDLCLPVARGGYHGLYIEMKAEGGKLSSDQRQWIPALISQGYAVQVCFGEEEAETVLLRYLNLKPQQ